MHSKCTTIRSLQPSQSSKVAFFFFLLINIIFLTNVILFKQFENMKFNQQKIKACPFSSWNYETGLVELKMLI